MGYEEDLAYDDHLTKRAKLNLALRACTLDNPTCINAASDKLEKHLEDPIENP